MRRKDPAASLPIAGRGARGRQDAEVRRVLPTALIGRGPAAVRENASETQMQSASTLPSTVNDGLPLLNRSNDLGLLRRS